MSESIILAGGCFWCLEAIFKRLKGVISVTSGYTGGTTLKPTYESVCSGSTGHAEAVEIIFDPLIITLETLLEVFWQLHDPTTLNQQGNDIGTQYRSAIFYTNEKQKNSAIQSKEKIEKSNLYQNPIVTEITQCSEFYPAEKHHHDFYNFNLNHSYCRLVIDPKIKNLYQKFKKLTIN